MVFTARNSDRAADAFRLEAVDFLMKPLDRLQVSETIKRLLAQLRPIEFGVFAGARHGPILPLNSARFSDVSHSLLPVTDADHDQIRLLARPAVATTLKSAKPTPVPP